MDRVAQLYYVTGNEHAKVILDRWTKWVLANVHLTKNGSFEIPSDLVWSGAPAAQLGRQDAELERPGRALQQDPAREGEDHRPGPGRGRGAGAHAALLRREVGRPRAGQAGQGAARPDVEEVPRRQRASRRPRRARTSSASATRSSSPPAGRARCRTATPSTRIRPSPASARRYTKDPDWPKIEAHLRGGPAPTFTYHRFWAQADIALAYATFAILYPDGIKVGSKAVGRWGRGGKGGRGEYRGN